MSQRAAFAEFDAACMADLADNGMADTGTYRSPDGDDTAITYLYDDTQFSDVGETGARVLVRERQIGLMLGEVTPVENGMADTGTYRSPDGDDTPATYLFDDTQFQDVGESGARVLVRERQIGLMLGEVTPVENGRVIGDDGRTWRLVAPTGEVDDSMSWWFVAPVRSDGA